MLQIKEFGQKFFIIRSKKASKYVYESVIVEAILIGSQMGELGYVINDFVDIVSGDVIQGIDSTMVFTNFQDATDFAKEYQNTVNEAEAKRESFDIEMKKYQKITIGEPQLENVVKFISELQSKSNVKH